MIYLDIDGVILLQGDSPLSPKAQKRANLVRNLAIATKSKIVICSLRRRSDDIINLIDDLQLSDLLNQGDWKTPFINHDDLDPDLPIRGQEIALHLASLNPAKHVILDDDFCLAGQNHVQVDDRIGLTDDDISKAHSFLDGTL